MNELGRQIKEWHRQSEQSQRLEKIPGLGPLSASAVVASVGDAKTFRNGRQFAAWLGLVPRQKSSGGKEQLFGISKRGDTYLRTLLIHGARSVLFSLKRHNKERCRLVDACGRTAESEHCCRGAGEQKRAHYLGAASRMDESTRPAMCRVRLQWRVNPRL